LIFTYGLIAFCRRMPRPLLALAISIPYLIIVVAMGYTRQSVSIAFLMLGIIWMIDGKTMKALIVLMIATLFHRSAAILVPLLLVAPNKNRIFQFAFVGLASLAVYESFLSADIDSLYNNYIGSRYASDGALPRVLMNILPAVITIIYRKKFHWKQEERLIWLILSWVAVASGIWLIFSPSSTAVDRVALYLIPLQLYFYSKLPDIIGGTQFARVWMLIIIIFYAVIQFVWLNYANFSHLWIPYRFMPLTYYLQV